MKRLIIGMLLAAFGCIGCEKGSKNMHNIIGEPVTYTAGETVLKGYLAYDGAIKGRRPGVLVVHEWWGHNDYARKRADMLAELGYTALAVDMYGDGQQANHPDDAMKFVTATMSNLEAAQAKFNAAMELLKQHETTNPEQTAAIGYCFGGGVVLNMARAGADLDAVVSFHGGLQAMAPAQPGNVKAKILVCNGAADPFVPQEQIDAFKSEMDSAGAAYEVINYAGAIHSFTNPMADSFGVKFNLPLAYNKAADEQSWQAMQQLFNEVFAKAEM